MHPISFILLLFLATALTAARIRIPTIMLIASLLTLAAPASAQIMISLHDSEDDPKLAAKAAELPAAAESRSLLTELHKTISSWKQRDWVALLGPAVKLPDNLALPIAHPRIVTLPGMRYTDEKLNHDHIDAYAVGTLGYLQVYYSIDGESSSDVAIYLQPDADFQKILLDAPALAKRLDWDQHKLVALRETLLDRWREVHPIQVDAALEKKQQDGDASMDIKTKLDAWKSTATAQHGRLVEEPASAARTHHWSWFDAQGNLIREAYPYTGNELPNVFIAYDPKTKKEIFRAEGMGQGLLHTQIWRRPDATNIRAESRRNNNGPSDFWRPDTWTWYDAEGHAMRVERDTNADGIPDTFTTPPADKHDKPLPLDQSWAVHPTLIPKENQIPDNSRAIPLKEIPKPAPKIITN